MTVQCDKFFLPFAFLLAKILRPPSDFLRARKPCLRLRFLCDGWYSVPNVLCLTCCNIGEGADDAADGMGNAVWVVRAPNEASD